MEEGMATHPSILAWRIPWTVEPGGLQSTGSQRVGHEGAQRTRREIKCAFPKCTDSRDFVQSATEFLKSGGLNTSLPSCP